MIEEKKDVFDEIDLEDEDLDLEEDEKEFEFDWKDEPQPKFIFHCKPVFNFQSVEFDFEGDEDDIPEMMRIYAKVMKELSKIAIAQPGQKFTVSEDAPTEKQIEILKRFNIKYNPDTITKKQAQQLINDNLNK